MSLILTGNSSTLTVDSTNGITFPNATLQASAGSVIQVVQAVKTNVQSTTSSSAVDVTGLSVSITPKFATSKILVMADLNTGMSTATGSISFLWIVRNSTNIYVGDAAGSRTQVWQAIDNEYYIASQQMRYTSMYLDSPATTSALTYKIQFNSNNGAVATYVNQSATDVNASYVGRTASSITVMEIAA